MNESRKDRLKVFEIFHSLQGESTLVGLPTVFIRLTGCPLRCVWCDTEYAFHGGAWMHFDEILAAVAEHGTRRVCVTGGEPLAQKRCLDLLEKLVDTGHDVSLETSGAVSVAGVHPAVIKVVDLKAPGSGEVDKNLWDNLPFLTARDQLKCVVADREDYLWFRDVHARCAEDTAAEFLLSPVADQLPAQTLAEWILADQLQVRLQIQLHKHLWGNRPGT